MTSKLGYFYSAAYQATLWKMVTLGLSTHWTKLSFLPQFPIQISALKPQTDC